MKNINSNKYIDKRGKLKLETPWVGKNPRVEKTPREENL